VVPRALGRKPDIGLEDMLEHSLRNIFAAGGLRSRPPILQGVAAANQCAVNERSDPGSELDERGLS
jgi:hypothetical protein